MDLFKCSKILCILTHICKFFCYFLIGVLGCAFLAILFAFNNITYSDNKVSIFDDALVLEIKDDTLIMNAFNESEELEVDNIKDVKKAFDYLKNNDTTKLVIVSELVIILAIISVVIYIKVLKNFENLFKNFLEEKIFTEENEVLLHTNAKYVLYTFILSCVASISSLLISNEANFSLNSLFTVLIIITIENIFKYARTNK